MAESCYAVKYKPFMLNVIMMNVILLSVVAPMNQPDYSNYQRVNNSVEINDPIKSSLPSLVV
jgi:hypothetical protein